MILFFHFICLLARYIVSNISKSLNTSKLFWDNETGDYCADDQFSEYLKEKAGHVKYPVYEDDTLKFFPPVYVQRYETVALILEDAAQKYKIKKVADFGCAELGFFMYLKYIEGVTEILEVDIDSEILEQYSFKAAPLTSDHLMGKWKKPLDVYVLAGSVADYDDHLIGCDAVIGIELIEHLSEEAFEKMPYNVFYMIKPKLVVFTTPNADFNSLFPNFSDLRHKDHKFEWTRKEFYDWTQLILKLYPEYSVKFYGIGAGPEGTENLGCCTQMAVFVRSDTDDSEYFVSAREENEGLQNYKLVQHYKYPFNLDTRTIEEKIVHEIQYQAAYLSTLDTYYNFETSESEIPLEILREFVEGLCSSNEDLKDILINYGMTVRQKENDWYLICSEVDSSPSDITSRCDDWLNDEMSGDFCDSDLLLNEKLWDDELPCSEYVPHFQSISDLKKLDLNSPDMSDFLCKVSPEFESKEKIKSAPHSCNHLDVAVDSPNLSVNCELKNSEKCKILSRSRIPRMKNKRYDNSSGDLEETGLGVASEPFKRISRAFSLDSCLENINYKLSESESFYLDLIPMGSMSSNIGDGFFWLGKRKHTKNFSGSSLLSSSLDRVGDSGYPFSFSLPDDNLTPEQVDELFTENAMMSRSTSSSSELDLNDINHRLHQDIFIEDVHVENGDLANNNRDGEGNNVEGLIGQRLINEIIAERDPNDNLFFPEPEEFPPWLLNLGELALQPVYFPLHDNDGDEGVEDNSSGHFRCSPDIEDIHYDF